MKRIIVNYDSITWNEILSWFDIKIASNLLNYNLGEDMPRDCENSLEAFKKLLEKNYELSLKEVKYIPFYAYIHGDISFNIDCSGQFCDRWDSGLAGYIWVSKRAYAKIFRYKRFSKKIAKNFEEEAKALIHTLNSSFYYINVYENNELIDSLGGLQLEYEDKDAVLDFIHDNGLISDGENFTLEWSY